MKKQSLIWDEEYSKNKRWNLETKDLPDILSGKIVLELGVGNGKTLRSIIKQKPLAVTAIDFSKKAISISEKEFSGSNVKLLVADVKKLPFNNSEFDIVICYFVLNNLKEKERIKAVSEILRVLKNKGVLLFQDFSEGDFRQEHSTRSIEKNTILKANGLIAHYFTKSELTGLFSNFKKRSFKEISFKPFKKLDIKRKFIVGKAIKS
jgi:ubiquinone/menaquinone biosynthesis C-methylase UbiE